MNFSANAFGLSGSPAAGTSNDLEITPFYTLTFHSIFLNEMRKLFQF